MGAKQSHRPPPPSPFFNKPWRNADWGKRDEMTTAIKGLTLTDLEMEHLRILLIGPIGAGKSSFINSVRSIFSGRVVVNVLAGTANISFTKKYETHYIKDGNGRLPFTVSDVMGLESNKSMGVHTDDIISIIKGHIREGYEFNPYSSLKQEKKGYNQSTRLSDKVHCLVNVVSADAISRMTSETKAKMRTIREKASECGIPQFVVMTMVDQACPHVMNDLKNVYRSKVVKGKMETCSNDLGVPMNCIFPVKNYHEETKLNNEMDVLVLEAMTAIVNAANDYMWDLQHHQPETS